MEANLSVTIVRGFGPSARTSNATIALQEHEIVGLLAVLRAAESAATDAFRASGPRKLADALEPR